MAQVAGRIVMNMLRKVSLEDKYSVEQGRVLLSGPQALTRLPIVQHLQDRAAGYRTGGFISGYQGSPLTNYDLNLLRNRELLDQNNIVFQPAVNEELAATACWGSQQLANFERSQTEGVFALWYGKGPGVDRATDAIKHANHSGTHPLGGVLAVFGDDHAAKSSTVAHNSEPAMAHMSVPVVYPANVEEFFDFGLFGWAMSRFTGLWTGFKLVNETIEQTATVDLDLGRSRMVVPEGGIFPPEGVHYNSAYTPARDDIIVTRYKLPLVHLFAKANPLDRTIGVTSGRRRLGIVAAGKSFLDVMQALTLLGIDANRAAALGLNVYKLGLIWPIEPEGLRAFASGHEELFIVEEKKPFIELQVARILYNIPNPPRLLGKRDEAGVELLPSDIPIDSVMLAKAIGERLSRLEAVDETIADRLGDITARMEQRSSNPAPYLRTAFYCSGCPHNTSTQLPEGSQGMGGIGCHGMATFTRSDTLGVTQMGGEGSTWIGAAPFVKTRHVFQNLGDGTYYHSGLLAIRAAVAAGINITYKILYNDATAMTGGQPLAGPISVGDISRQVAAEGVKKVVVVTDAPSRYTAQSRLAPGVDVYARDDLDKLQRELREIPGVTVLIYEQTCAAEKRRRRKRGEFADPPKRMFINEAVCEGCGDCSVQSNCVSLFPVETALGRKRAVDQSTCNKDYSCVRGFCPSFVTVTGGNVRKPRAQTFDPDQFAGLPVPATRNVEHHAIMVAGIGGTGVVTIGAVLAMAAHLEGLYASSYDMTGMSQKGGAVYSHIRIGRSKSAIASQKISTAEADLLIGSDLVASGGGDAFQSIRSGVTRIVANSSIVPTSESQKSIDAVLSPELLQRRLSNAAGNDIIFADASTASLALLGDTIGANFFLVGVALQSGGLPLAPESIERAIELNGAAVQLNQTAFRLGRLWFHDPAAVEAMIQAVLPPRPPVPQTVAEILDHRISLLTAYQSSHYAERYARLVKRVRNVEAERTPDRDTLTRAVATSFAKLMAYKDEYEVGRLYSQPEFRAALDRQFEGGYRLKPNLAPPLLARRNPLTGTLKKREFGPWVFTAFRILAKLRGLRGTAIDPFGWTAERRKERAWIDRYESLVLQLCDHLNTTNHSLALEIARIPEQIRGFGHVKERHWTAAEERLGALMRQWQRKTRQAKANVAA